MNQGHIEEQGTHQQLLDGGGLYAHIYRAQLQVETGAAGAVAR
jgi:ABC-type bacteriocin/lantibiotic exporter with double-glycine peptidase domain